MVVSITFKSNENRLKAIDYCKHNNIEFTLTGGGIFMGETLHLAKGFCMHDIENIIRFELPKYYENYNNHDNTKP